MGVPYYTYSYGPQYPIPIIRAEGRAQGRAVRQGRGQGKAGQGRDASQQRSTIGALILLIGFWGPNTIIIIRNTKIV